MTGERELHTATQRHTLNRRDTRLAHLLDATECQVCVVRQHSRLIDGVDLVEKLADIRTGDKRRRAIPGEDHRLHIVAPRQVIDHDVQFIQRTFIQRIHRRIRDVHRRHFRACCQRIVLHAEVAVALEQLLLLGQLLRALPVVDRALQFDDGFRVTQCAGIANVRAFDQCPYHAPHILAAAGLRELRDLDKVARHGHGTLLKSHQF